MSGKLFQYNKNEVNRGYSKREHIVVSSWLTEIAGFEATAAHLLYNEAQVNGLVSDMADNLESEAELLTMRGWTKEVTA